MQIDSFDPQISREGHRHSPNVSDSQSPGIGGTAVNWQDRVITNVRWIVLKPFILRVSLHCHAPELILFQVREDASLPTHPGERVGSLPITDSRRQSSL